MGCIDIFAPGRLLTVPFLMEQIWLHTAGKNYFATEVYDFLLQVDDDQPLISFLIGYPNFCRIQKPDGSWQDTLTLSRVADHRSGWGWFYIGSEQYDDSSHELQMTVAASADPSGDPTVTLTGLDQPKSQLVWHPELESTPLVQCMQDIRKSLYQVTLSDPLPPHGARRIWFRLIVRPTILDAPHPNKSHPTNSWIY